MKTCPYHNLYQAQRERERETVKLLFGTRDHAILDQLGQIDDHVAGKRGIKAQKELFFFAFRVRFPTYHRQHFQHLSTKTESCWDFSTLCATNGSRLAHTPWHFLLARFGSKPVFDLLCAYSNLHCNCKELHTTQSLSI